ncbi:hypothetical protein BD413DRAFT_651330 [Trametes elegans]|nr:hypothetical protein BD413DRAFT_651330 [Trametes elegans]
MSHFRLALSSARPCRRQLCRKLPARRLSTPAVPELPSLSNLEHAALLSNTNLTKPTSPVIRSTEGPPTEDTGLEPEGPGELSDQEWEIRTGRAIYILQQTLPTFFSTGLISSLDTSVANSGSEPVDDTSIYSPNIRLVYRPPTPFPPPFPRTLHIEGLSLYLTSSVILRHTLNALYTDLRVELQRVRVHGPRSSSSSGLSADSPPGSQQQEKHKTRSIREKSLFVGIAVHGINRVSKAESGWEVNSTYTFSPNTGLIHIHTIDSIHPAPHQAFFDALQAALSKLGIGGSPGESAGGVAPISSRARADFQVLTHAADRS